MDPVEGKLIASGLRFAVVASRFNQTVVERLLDGALDALRRAGADSSQIMVVRVPGAFEIPMAVRRLAVSGKVDGIVAIGCVIRGETPHFEYISGEVTRGLGQVAVDTGVPVGFGVLTVDSAEQAFARAGMKAGNKGAEAALAAVEMIHVMRQI